MRHQYWCYVPAWNVAVCAPPKCGSRSVLLTIVQHFYPAQDYQTATPSVFKERYQYYQYMGRHALKDRWPKLAIMRNPVDRFASLWAHHCRDGVPGIPKKLRNGAKMHHLLEWIRNDLYGNPHWAPQTNIIGNDLTPGLKICDLKMATTTWQEFMPATAPPLAHVNQTSSPVPVPDYIVEQLKLIYEDDFRVMP